jgi:hypothetical protein
MPANFLADFHRGRGHNVEVAGVLRQKIPRALDFDEESDFLFTSAVRLILNQRLGAEPVAGTYCLMRSTMDSIDYRISSVSASSMRPCTVLRMKIGGSAGFSTMMALPHAA